MPLDRSLATPDQHRVGGQLGSVVRDDHARPAALGNELGHFADNPAARDRRLGHGAKTLARHIINDVEHPAPAPCEQLSWTKSRLQRRLGSVGTGGGIRAPTARLRPLRRRTVKPSSRYSHCIFLRLISTPSRRPGCANADSRSAAALAPAPAASREDRRHHRAACNSPCSSDQPQ
jgi:hypothetical protein